MLWQPHPRHGLSQPVKTLLSWFKANLILQTSAALGLFHNGQVCWGRLPGRGGGGVCVCVRVRACACVHVCVHACTRSVCARVRVPAPVASAPLCACAHLRFAWTRVRGTRPAPPELSSYAGPGSFRDCFISGQVLLQQKPKGQTLVQSPEVLLPPLRLPWGH